MFYKILVNLLLVLLGVSLQLFSVSDVYAESFDNLKLKISNKNIEIKALEAETKRLDKEIKTTENERQTLNTELRQIDAVKKRLGADIKLTIKKIDVTTLHAEELKSKILDKNKSISVGQFGIAESIRMLNENSIMSLLERVLSDDRLAMIWNDVSELESIEDKTMERIKALRVIKKELEESKVKFEIEKVKAVALKNLLSDQKKIAEQNVAIKNKLIVDTKNKESNYKKLLLEVKTRRAAVENELLQYESELRIIIDPKSLPSSGTKVLSWPLDQVYITQYFGQTEFAKTRSVYNGKGHSGIDLRASVGTPLRSSGDGIVLGTGDTDPVCYGASYGKWIMIDHKNGIATIYGHLSLIKVSAGQKISRGDLIGYTGKTGYATGPHLHFTVAATQAVKIANLKSKVKGCGTYTIPLGPFSGYLNPLLYL